jgi:hypothetical protein
MSLNDWWIKAGAMSQKITIKVFIALVALFVVACSFLSPAPLPPVPVAATLPSVFPTTAGRAETTPEAPATITASKPETLPVLDKSDFASVVQWLNYMMNHKKPEMITALVGSNGTRLLSYGVGADPLGYNNADEVFKILEESLVRSEPACHGYNPNFGSLPDKGIIYFRGINFNWQERGVSTDGVKDNMSGFQFYKQDQGWELTWITPIPEWAMPDSNSLLPCSED